jgi:hypothetical protein
MVTISVTCDKSGTLSVFDRSGGCSGEQRATRNQEAMTRRTCAWHLEAVEHGERLSRALRGPHPSWCFWVGFNVSSRAPAPFRPLGWGTGAACRSELSSHQGSRSHSIFNSRLSKGSLISPLEGSW